VKRPKKLWCNDNVGGVEIETQDYRVGDYLMMGAAGKIDFLCRVHREEISRVAFSGAVASGGRILSGVKGSGAGTGAGSTETGVGNFGRYRYRSGKKRRAENRYDV
jgi:hypothetical protein